ncbi:hypothetical protein OG985_23835 [Streptomyces sp. NBC_00289]|uniref:hypothetical protein n=1 Tax=Streptomyces sp. NBC_00289 TaxID=2975703 RepID=UPI003243D4E8
MSIVTAMVLATAVALVTVVVVSTVVILGVVAMVPVVVIVALHGPGLPSGCRCSTGFLTVRQIWQPVNTLPPSRIHTP